MMDLRDEDLCGFYSVAGCKAKKGAESFHSPPLQEGSDQKLALIPNSMERGAPSANGLAPKSSPTVNRPPLTVVAALVIGPPTSVPPVNESYTANCKS